MIAGILSIISGFILHVIEATGYFGIFFLMALESANIPIPSEIIMPFSGFLASAGIFYFWAVVLAGAFGNLIGSLFSYWLGYLVRKGIFYRDNNKVSIEVKRAQKWLDQFGDLAIFIPRLLPIVRTFISFPLGVIKVKSLWRFSFLTFGGSFLWSALLTYLGFVSGKNWEVLSIYFRKFDYIILGLMVLALIWWFKSHIKPAKFLKK
ncbi:MAG: DedA family protein [Patescibacteria group bacterium]